MTIKSIALISAVSVFGATASFADDVDALSEETTQKIMGAYENVLASADPESLTAAQFAAIKLIYVQDLDAPGETPSVLLARN